MNHQFQGPMVAKTTEWNYQLRAKLHNSPKYMGHMLVNQTVTY